MTETNHYIVRVRAESVKETLDRRLQANKVRLAHDIERLEQALANIKDHQTVGGFEDVAYRLVQLATEAGYIAMRANVIHAQDDMSQRLDYVVEEEK